MKNNKSTNILLIGFGLILILLFASSVVGLSSMSEINQNMEAVVKNRIVKTELLQIMRNYVRERSISLHRIIMIKDPFELDEEIQHFSNQASYWLKAKENLMAHNMDAMTKVILDELYKTGGAMYAQQNKIVLLIQNQQNDEAYKILFDKVIPGQNKVIKKYEEILNYQKELSEKALAQSESDYHDAVISLMVITILLLGIGITIAYFVIRYNSHTEKKILKDKQKIEYFAYHDTLTSLPNRRLLMDRLQLEIGHSKRLHNFGAVMFIDVDNFKILNDSLGHKFGDKLIQQVGGRIARTRRSDDTVARLGGDEFVVVLPALANNIENVIQSAKRIGEQLRTILSNGYMLDGMEYHITVSIGITIIKNGQQTAGELLKQSDSALYAAKNAGRNIAKFYEKSMQEEADNRLSIERDIRSALNTGQFILYYQPQINNNGAIIGVEALVRWNHPIKGFITPDKFISAAEESGLIIPLGIEILDNACRFLKSLEQNGLSDSFTSLSVNISPNQFAQPDFVDIVKEIIQKYDINPSYLMLEITEGMLLHNIDDIVVKMKSLKELSVHFSIDDFGTGYSSMLYLQRLPLDELKIDQSFIKDVDTNNHNAAIVETIITMGKNLNLTLIAEGVEEESQRNFLSEHGCNNYQGYLFEKPIAGDVLQEKYFDSEVIISQEG